ncbi:MAG TPA: rRNA large subunit methyltransferase I [Syntrophobacteraceae bacterium]|jgi:23S rRNA (cytosine1962-C5)-methyltransferase|nr:rRNA large subunit methyltransferase I [Syntrophobacteraceae bacterium]HBD10385.1 rRNA large subunit methyltransferase I [Syntrophobacteraceae bacterium]HBZ54618.1 rRNA large subunit methyltransferase I [Syntrophobacteraceae bacterium]
MDRITLRPGAERRLLQGHCWIFSNEIADGLKETEPGSWVQVYNNKGTALGSGYVNPHSLIAVRLVCPPGKDPDRSFFVGLLRRAAQYRHQVYPGSRCHRLIYGEADGLPGLVVDRYEEVLVYQITTMGMARLEPLLQEILLEEFNPQALVYRHDVKVRELEGLEQTTGVAFGQVPPQLWVEIDGLEFCADPLAGQKTGLYLDQRDNRKALAKWVAGRRVLDLFCYDGSWSLAAARSGASEVVSVDRSSSALQRAQLNAQRNRLDSSCRFHQEDVLAFLKEVPRNSFEVVIVDPPAFAKTRKALPEAQKGYIDLNRRALLALSSGGLLVSCSCSHHVSEELFQALLLRAAQASGRRLRLIEARGQALDHPILLAMPETRYLKCYFLEAI